MTIKEIAELAGVSVATVSKVVNKKDESIRPETRKRIMQIVREYHYTPFGEVLTRQQQRRNFLIGIVFDAEGGNDYVLPALSRAASRNNYSVVLTMCRGGEEEQRSFQILAAQKVDGILYYPVKNSDFDAHAFSEKYGIPILRMDFRARCDAENFCIDYYSLGYQLTDDMINLGHERILCLEHIHGQRAQLMSQGYLQCLRDHGMEARTEDICSWPDYNSEPELTLMDYTAVICYDLFLARKLVELAEQSDLSVPGDVSVATVGGGEPWMSYENISALSRSPTVLARAAVKKLIDRIEGIPNDEELSLQFEYNHRRSMDIPKSLRSKCLMTVGSIAVETALHLSGQETGSRLRFADEQVMRIGGSGLRQVMTARELGVACYPVLRLGNDAAGRKIYSSLKKDGVSVEFLTLEDGLDTPQIYTLYSGGHKQRILAGASELRFTPEELAEKRNLIKRCHFVLMQSGPHMSSLLPLVKLARRYAVRTVLKVNAMEDLASLPQAAADILVVPELSVGLTEEERKRLLCQGAELIIALGDGQVWWSYQGAAQTAPCGPLADPESAADRLASALACFLPVNDRTQETVSAAVARAAAYIAKKEKSEEESL